MQVESERKGADERLSRGLRNYWYPVFRSQDLGAQPVGIKRLGEDLALWRDSEGRPHLFTDYCAHRAAKLSLGQVHGDILQCWYHGWQYDTAGRCALIPTEGEGCPTADRVRLTSYPVEDRGGLIWAYLGDATLFPPPPLHVPEELESHDWNGFILPVVWQVNWLLYLDNLVDPMHGPFLHARSYTLSGGTRQDSMRVVETDDGLVSERVAQRLVNFDGAEFHLPSWFRVDIPYPRSAGPGGPLHVLVAATPIDENSSAFYFVRMRRVTGWKWRLWQLTWRLYLDRAAWNVIEQDRVILESQRGLESRRGEHLVGSDLGVIRLRMLLQRELANQDARGVPLGPQ
ncbi:MAG: Aromatic ring-hydroxylating dioxygenase subunit alpha [Chloroflexi bacterium]|nr:Aromatic ring-hydroxylating dioxygenase subunit alpha [Chloroflexota bacterium]